jgi:hypothetical protein
VAKFCVTDGGSIIVISEGEKNRNNTGLVSASEAVCASILPRTILYIHTASASEVDNIPPAISKLKGGKMEVPVPLLP